MKAKQVLILMTCVLVLGFFTEQPAAQEPDKKTIGLNDFERWRNVGSAGISDNGQWVTFAYSTPQQDDTLYVKNLSTDKTIMIPRGSSPKFSDDGTWVAYTIRPTVKEIKKLEKDKKPVPVEAELLNLDTEEKFTVDNAASFYFPKGSAFFVVQKKGAAGAKYKGADLILRNLSSGMNLLLGSVSDFGFNKPGTVLAYTVDSADSTGNGVYYVDLAAGTLNPLDTGKAAYTGMAWDEEGHALALLKGVKKKGVEHRDNMLLAFTGFDAGQPQKTEYDPAEAFDFPKGYVLSENGSLSWNTARTMVFCGIRQQEESPGKDIKKKIEENPVPDINIFHYQDDRLQTVQKQQASRERRFTYRSVFQLQEKRFVRLTDEEMRDISVTRDGKWGIGRNEKPYVSDWKPQYADLYRVDTKTGERTMFLEKQYRTLGMSPDSRHFLYWRDGQIWDYRIEKDENVNLTGQSPVSFVNDDYDRFGEKPAYGVAGWTKDGESVILNHQFDLYQQPLDGGPAKNLTGGKGTEEEIVLRYIRTDPEAKFIDLKKPLLLSAFGKWTKKAGFYELAGDKLNELIYEDRRFGRVAKAKNADKFMYSIEDFRSFPDYYVSDADFSFPKKVTDAIPWQSKFAWGRRILFEYTNNDGVRLQGTLAIPDGYKEGDKLPMLVQFYEKYSQNLHSYYPVRYRHSPNFARFVSNGYLVMQPDIHFRIGSSHTDMLECVEAAVQKVIDLGYADPDRVGLHGHSYSGGGAAFISTRSTMFAAIMAGAAPINLRGEFNILFTGSGQNNHSYDIYGQGRYGTNPYDDPDVYFEQSPITYVTSMNTPLLYLHGEADGTVEYNQGMEFYNALRFNNKPVIFLSYPGEGHGLRRFENQKDCTLRIHQFFDHYLKGAEAPAWMTEGLPYLEKEKMRQFGEIKYKK